MTEETTNALALINPKNIQIVNNNKERAAKINQVGLAIRQMENNLDDYNADLEYAAFLKELKEAITDDQISLLQTYQNNRIGFLTDKPGQGYPHEVLRNIFIEAISLGLRIRGNEFNILGGNLYTTKIGLARLLDDLIDRNNYNVVGRDNPKISITSTGNYNVVYEVSVKDSLGKEVLPLTKREILIKGKFNRGEKVFELGIDAVQAKAQRKLDNYLYSKLSKRKNLLPEGSVEDVDMPVAKSASKISVTQILSSKKEEEIIEGETEDSND